MEVQGPYPFSSHFETVYASFLVSILYQEQTGTRFAKETYIMTGMISMRVYFMQKKSVLKLINLLNFTVLFCLISAGPQKSSAYSGTKALPLFQIHRGYLEKGKNVENTINAFRAAKQFGHNMIELDVRFSKDRVVMVYHDDNLKRLSHVDKQVDELTSEELKEYSIPTLHEVLLDEKIPYFVNVEIKSELSEDFGLETAVVKVLNETKAMDRLIISSFNEAALGRIAILAPNLERAYLTAKAGNETDNEFLTKVKKPMNEAQTHILHIYYGSVTESLAAMLHKNGILFRVWTVDTQQDVTDMLKLGAAGVITNSVDLNP